MTLNRYKKLELEKIHLRDRLKSLKCSKEIEEIKEIIYRINKICDTDYYLDV